MTRHKRATDRLNALLRAELAAVLVYQQARRSLVGRLGNDTERVVGFDAGHQRNVAALQGCIRSLGEVPAAGPGASSWSSFALLPGGMSVRQLLEAEENGLAEYEAALPSLGRDIRDLVVGEVIPRQRQHMAMLSRILSDLRGA